MWMHRVRPRLATPVLAGVVVVGFLGCGSDTGTNWVVFDAGDQLDAELQEHNTDSNVEADFSGGESGDLAERDAEPGVEVPSPQHFLPNNLIPGYSPCVQFDAAECSSIECPGTTNAYGEVLCYALSCPFDDSPAVDASHGLPCTHQSTEGEATSVTYNFLWVASCSDCP